MNEWVWLTTEAVLAMHGDQIALHGGSFGIRDKGMLESALARPRNLAAYEEPDVSLLAATYAHGICANHPFLDGNKRTSLLAAATFLVENGFELEAAAEDSVTTFLQLASGALTPEELANWIRDRIRPLE